MTTIRGQANLTVRFENGTQEVSQEALIGAVQAAISQLVGSDDVGVSHNGVVLTHNDAASIPSTKPMYIVAWTTSHDDGPQIDHYSIVSDFPGARRAIESAQNPDLYCWGIACIVDASEPHWVAQ